MGRPERRKTKNVKEVINIEELQETQRINYDNEGHEDTGFFFRDKKEESLEKGASSSVSDIQAIQLAYEKKIDLLEKEVKAEKARKTPLGRNEEKLLNAIRSESLIQSTDQPIMSRPYLRLNYGMNEKYLGDAIKDLVRKKIILRSPAKSNGQSSFSWKLLI
jgi:wobble nucleotide-excising tRNase